MFQFIWKYLFGVSIQLKIRLDTKEYINCATYSLPPQLANACITFPFVLNLKAVSHRTGQNIAKQNEEAKS